MALLPSGLPELVGDDEDLARFLAQRSHFNSMIAKPAAFLPNARDRETSISRHGPSPIEKLWFLGLAAAGDRRLYGAAIFKARDIRNAHLDAVADEPPEYHAVIRGWPWIDDDPELQKARQKELALLLASAAGPPIFR